MSRAKTSIRDLVRRDRWATAYQSAIDAERDREADEDTVRFTVRLPWPPLHFEKPRTDELAGLDAWAKGAAPAHDWDSHRTWDQLAAGNTNANCSGCSMCRPHVVCSPENLAYLAVRDAGLGAEASGYPFPTIDGLRVVVDQRARTWQTFPRPKWWRRWFLRAKQQPPRRVFYVVDLGRQAYRYSVGEQFKGAPDDLTVTAINYGLGSVTLVTNR